MAGNISANRETTTAGLNRLLLIILPPVIAASLLALRLDGARSGFASLYGASLTAVYYYMYFICVRLARDKSINYVAGLMMITYLVRLTVIGAGLYLSIFVIKLAPLLTMGGFMLSHVAVLLMSGGAFEVLSQGSIGPGKEREQRA